ncbi:MAG TPA: biotin transporter BioY [Propionibacteriaceae bacterium]|nr:biotin transporter BioY [Propionibacteriaceae bacterium]
MSSNRSSMTGSRSSMTDVALIAVFAALIATVTVWVPGINVPGSTVPITLQTLAIGLTAFILGPWRAFAATTLYLLVGFAGLPVFAGQSAGLGVLAKPSAGYLLSFPLYALVVGFASSWVLRRGLKWAVGGLFLAGLVGSILVVHPMGILGLMRNADLTFSKALAVDMIYWPGDVIKTAVAAVIAIAVHKAFPALAVRRYRLAEAV